MDVNQIWCWVSIQNTKFCKSEFLNSIETNINIVKFKTKCIIDIWTNNLLNDRILWLMLNAHFLQEAKQLSNTPKINSYYFCYVRVCV